MTQQTVTVSAQDLLGSFGVNTHSSHFANDAYDNAALVIRSMNYLGLSLVRDNYRADGVPGQVLSAMASAGIKFDFVISNTAGTTGSAGVASFVDSVASFAAANPGTVVAIEGQNEVDIFGTNYAGDTSLAAAGKIQQLLYTDVKAYSVLADVKVFNMALGREANYASLGNLSAYSDYANAHFYGGASSNVSQTYANSIALAEAPAAHQGYVVTETGFSTAASAAGYTVDEVAQAKMTLADLLMAYANGSVQSYVYELLDTPSVNNTLASSPTAEKSFGLFNADGTPKLAATTLHNFTSLLTTTGGHAVVGSVNVQGLGADGHSMSVAKAAGGSDLVIWRDVSAYDKTKNVAVTVAAVPVTVTFGSIQAHVYVYNPLNGLTPIASYANVFSITLPVSDTPLMIELGSDAPYTEVAAVAASPTLTIDAATFVATINQLSKTSGITAVNLTGAHTLQIASLDTMKDLLANYSVLLGKISGGFSFNIESIGAGSKTETLYDKTGALVSTSSYTMSGNVVTALDVVNFSGATDHYSYVGGVLASETHIAADGSRSTITYNETGHAVQRVDISAQATTTTTSVFDPASGVLTTKTVFNADKSGDVWDYGITGKTYVSDHSVYLAGNVLYSLTRLHADGSRDFYAQYNKDGSIQQDFYSTTGVLTQDIRTVADGSTSTLNYDSTGRLVTRYDVSAQNVKTGWTFDPASGATQVKTIFNPDKSGDVWHYGITGKSYVSDHITYGAGSVQTSLARLHADGSRDYYEQDNADGSVVKDSYTSAGVITQEVRIASDGSTSTLTYDASARMTTRVDLSAQTVKTTWTFDPASGTILTQAIVNPDKSGDLWHYGITGKTYVSDHITYGAGNVQTSLTRIHADGTTDYFEKFNADGSSVKDYYTAAGVITQEVRAGADGSSGVLTYSAGHLITRLDVSAQKVTTTTTYDATSGATLTKMAFATDKSGDVWTYGITGKTYVTEHAVYAAGNVLASLTRLHTNGTRDYYQQNNADGSVVKDFYTSAGVITQETRSGADGSTNTLTYDSTGHLASRYDVSAQSVKTTTTYDPTSGAVTSIVRYNADKSGDQYHYGITGQSYVSDHVVLGAGSVYVSTTRYHADGTLDYFEQKNADGSKLVDTYDAAGNKLLETVTTAEGVKTFHAYTETTDQHTVTANLLAYTAASGSSLKIAGTPTVNLVDASGHVIRTLDASLYTIQNGMLTLDTSAVAVQLNAGDHATVDVSYAVSSGSAVAPTSVYSVQIDGTFVALPAAPAALAIPLPLAAVASSASQTIYGSTGHVTQQISTAANGAVTTLSFNAITGAVTSKLVVNADKSSDLYQFGIAGQNYTSDHYIYSSTGATLSISQYYDDGKLRYYSLFNVDGSKVVSSYDANGFKTLDVLKLAAGSKLFYAYAEVTDQQTVTANLFDYTSATGTKLTLASTPTVTLMDDDSHVVGTVDSSKYTITNGVLTMDASAVAGSLNVGQHVYVNVSYAVTNGSTVAPLSVYNLQIDGTHPVVQARFAFVSAAAQSDSSALIYDAAGNAIQEVTTSTSGVVTTFSYDSVSGALTTKLVVNPDKSSDVYHYGITGQNYTSDHYVYSARGATVSISQYYDDGTLRYYALYNVDGSKVVSTYDTNGFKTLDVLKLAAGSKLFYAYAEATDHEIVSANLFEYTSATGAILKIAGTPIVTLLDADNHVIDSVDAGSYSITNGVLSLDTHAVAGDVALGDHVYINVSYAVTNGATTAPLSVYNLQIDGTLKVDPVTVGGNGQTSLTPERIGAPSSSQITIIDDSRVSIGGSNVTVNIGAHASVDVSGANDKVHVIGEGSIVSIGGNGQFALTSNTIDFTNGGIANVLDHSRVDVLGDGVTVLAGDNNTIRISGVDDTVKFGAAIGSGAVWGLDGDDQIMLAKSSMNVGTGGDYWSYVFSHATVSGNDTTIKLDDGDTLVLHDFALTAASQHQVGFY